MTGSWKIGRIAGIDVYLHFTFLLLLGWVAYSHYLAQDHLASTTAALLSIVVLFGLVVLHEAGHALAARRYGIQTRDIVLLPIGGMARLERMPEDPLREAVVALAGPAVNLLLAAGTYLVLALGRRISPSGEAIGVAGGFLDRFLWINVSLALFNLLPAFPMDGGRVLRAFLAMRLGYPRATWVAALVGQAMAIVFALVGVVYNPLLLLIALFVSFAAAREANRMQSRLTLAGLPVRPVMITDFRTLRPSDTLARAAEIARALPRQDFPVIEDGRLVGLLTRQALDATLGRDGPDAPVGDVMRRQFLTARPDEPLQTALARLRKSGDQTLLVTENGRLLGMVTEDELADVLTALEVLRAAQRPRHHPEENGRGIRTSSAPGHGQAYPLNGVPRRGTA